MTPARQTIACSACPPRWPAGAPAATPRHRARGFTLAEMLVALGVMIVAMTVVATVFSLTTRTAATSTGLAEAQTLLRAFTQQIEADLAGVDPRNSVLVIVGRTQQASLTADNIAAKRYLRTLVGDPNQVATGYQPEFAPATDRPNDPNGGEYSDPRADLLMFFTQRPLASQAPPPDLNPPGPANQNYPFLIGAKMSPSQIVYGHAAIDEAVQVGTSSPPTYNFANNLKHIRPSVSGGPSELPITRWPLARRQTIIRNTASTTDLGFDAAEFERIVRSHSDPSKSPNDPGDAAQLNFSEFLRRFGPQLDATTRLPNLNTSMAVLRPYTFSREVRWQTGRDLIEGGGSAPGVLVSPTSVAPRVFRHVATVIEDPPGNLRSNLALQALPACGWFQVEFLMPEDPRNARDYFDARSSPPAPGRNLRGDMPRWVSVPDNQTYTFVPDTDENRRLVASLANTAGVPSGRAADFAQSPPPAPGAPGTIADRRIRMWPYAIRITVRVYDRLNRFTEPLERTIVHRFD